MTKAITGGKGAEPVGAVEAKGGGNWGKFFETGGAENVLQSNFRVQSSILGETYLTCIFSSRCEDYQKYSCQNNTNSIT
jgi:hypothetical protein